jgi:hypothetical protein
LAAARARRWTQTGIGSSGRGVREAPAPAPGIACGLAVVVPQHPVGPCATPQQSRYRAQLCSSARLRWPGPCAALEDRSSRPAGRHPTLPPPAPRGAPPPQSSLPPRMWRLPRDGDLQCPGRAAPVGTCGRCRKARRPGPSSRGAAASPAFNAHLSSPKLRVSSWARPRGRKAPPRGG